MENHNLEQENNLLGNDYFIISYQDQNYKILPNYQEWKRLMIEKYGDDGKEIKCWNDNTIFYAIHNDNEQILTCPTCKKWMYKCIFCNEVDKFNCHTCCFRACFYYIAIKICKKPIENKNMLYLFIFPFISTFISIYAVFGAFFIRKVKYERMIDLEANFFLILTIFLYIALMSIIFGIIYHLLLIVFFILSIPCKLYPIKIYFILLDFMKS